MSEQPGARVAAVRRFNRFYTRQIGILQEGLLSTPFTLTDARVLYELAHREAPTAKALATDLELDPGYLSRILRRFRQQRLVVQQASDRDGRERILSLTRPGQRAFAELDARASEEVQRSLGALSATDQQRMTDAMQTIEGLLHQRRDAGPPYILRPHRAGDIGWVIQRHAALYTQEYGWNHEFEALVAKIAARFLERFDPRAERCWIAERNGEPVGSVFLVRKSATVAQLRLLLVEPSARGLGIGARLVDECERFARGTGYRRIVLWTQRNLLAAGHIYRKAGYQLMSEEPNHSFGKDLVSQIWEKRLGA